MKILFTGGGSGGHFYPIIAVARSLKKIIEQERLVGTKLFLAGDSSIDSEMLRAENISFIYIPSGKLRRYLTPLIVTDILKMIFGIILAFWRMYIILPDVIFSKGGYSSFPVLFVARILRIPVMIHESDIVPGIVNQWSGNWVKRIALSYADAAENFKNKNIAITGQPIRLQVIGGNEKEAIETFKLEEGFPTLLILGGSQGSLQINEVILSSLSELVKSFQIIHQTGITHFKEISQRAQIVLENNEMKHRYHPYEFLDEGDLRNSSKVASIVVARAGSMIFEIAAWAKPSILVPLPNSAQDHQRKNAYAYARAGGCIVLEEENFTTHLFIEELTHLLANKEKMATMSRAAQGFGRLDAADVIAREIIAIGIHE